MDKKVNAWPLEKAHFRCKQKSRIKVKYVKSSNSFEPQMSYNNFENNCVIMAPKLFYIAYFLVHSLANWLYLSLKTKL